MSKSKYYQVNPNFQIQNSGFEFGILKLFGSIGSIGIWDFKF
jgi:hypothetical protein